MIQDEMAEDDVSRVELDRASGIALRDTLHKADCVDLTEALPRQLVHLTLTSPNYDDIRDYTGGRGDLVALAKVLLPATVEGGIAVLVMQDQTRHFAKSGTTFRTAVEWMDAGWRLFECCIYARDGREGAYWRSRPRVDHEYLLIFFKGKRPRVYHKDKTVPCLNAGKTYSGTQRLTSGEMRKIPKRVVNPLKCRGTLWRYATSNSEGNRLKMRHPATFPDALARDVIEMFSDAGDVVYDPMVGSGTTCLMAASLGRHYIGGDVEPSYIEIAREQFSTPRYQFPKAARGRLTSE